MQCGCAECCTIRGMLRKPFESKLPDPTKDLTGGHCGTTQGKQKQENLGIADWT